MQWLDKDFFIAELEALGEFQVFSIGNVPNKQSSGLECLVLIDRMVDFGYLLRLNVRDLIFEQKSIEIDGMEFSMDLSELPTEGNPAAMLKRELELASQGCVADEDWILKRAIYRNERKVLPLIACSRCDPNPIEFLSTMLFANFYETHSVEMLMESIIELLSELTIRKKDGQAQRFTVKDLLCVLISIYAIMEINIDDALEIKVQKAFVNAMLSGASKPNPAVSKWIQRVFDQVKALSLQRRSFHEFRSLVDPENPEIYTPFVKLLAKSLLNPPTSQTDLVYHESKHTTLIGGLTSFLSGISHPSSFKKVTVYFIGGVTFGEVIMLKHEFREHGVQLTVGADCICNRETLMSTVLKTK